MKKPTVSVVIPASNEEGFIIRAIESVRRDRSAECEIIVVVNGSHDKTSFIANELADRCMTFVGAIGPAQARNAGASIANGEVLLFVDADAEILPGTISAVEKICVPDSFGTVLGHPEDSKISHKIYLGFKNFVHKSGFYHGTVDGVMFADKHLFTKLQGFKSEKSPDEFYDFSRRARGAGAKYLVLRRPHVIVSMRRFRREGFVRTFWLWVRIRSAVLLGGNTDAYLGQYFHGLVASERKIRPPWRKAF
ncbi:MAG: hypothetical protein COV07_00745 [Candidatus Vogelbacteria bacterium CG10_big_fil_rev_8_21_14_0_10_45_14]|uniref:Glycosyltransferase 2-like domain-containing protein n=1 Tax=Candidatus Vogelbacteria bacterium CG10_big_fil_rev_8_21_14_0_10_45_14 TaxID=1975042 RepID=A0A2H0RL06_9BACT|nr:MAG: hypothetical protein COV07_00745 [Candidatus Vogelbacteria bacterium CG10_big_fil_rev_8_21_14_0_10_45_14]